MKRLFFTCLVLVPLLPAVGFAQCEGIAVSQDDPYVVIDHDAQYNCAVFAIDHDVVLDGTVLSITEVATADAWADCYCPYTSKVVIGGLEPGDYMLSYAYGEMVAGGDPPVFSLCEMPFQVSVPDLTDGEITVQTTASGCGIAATGVQGSPPSVDRNLTEIRARFH